MFCYSTLQWIRTFRSGKIQLQNILRHREPQVSKQTGRQWCFAPAWFSERTDLQSHDCSKLFAISLHFRPGLAKRSFLYQHVHKICGARGIKQHQHALANCGCWHRGGNKRFGTKQPTNKHTEFLPPCCCNQGFGSQNVVQRWYARYEP